MERSFLASARIVLCTPAWAWTNEVKALCRKITVENHVVIRRQLPEACPRIDVVLRKAHKPRNTQINRERSKQKILLATD